MARYLATIDVMLKALVNDPQGLAVVDGLSTLGFDGVDTVRASHVAEAVSFRIAGLKET